MFRLEKFSSSATDLMSEVLDKTKALSEEANARSLVEHERAQAVEELRLEAETKVALFSDATHHLNNPLNHITGAREIIGGELLLDPGASRRDSARG